MVLNVGRFNPVCLLVGPPEQGSLCASNQFQCGDGSCIPMSHLCDRDSDCDDGSDENNCSKFALWIVFFL